MNRSRWTNDPDAGAAHAGQSNQLSAVRGGGRGLAAGGRVLAVPERLAAIQSRQEYLHGGGTVAAWVRKACRDRGFEGAAMSDPYTGSADGRYNIPKHDPAYHPLDRGGDGIACER